ncbi:MAG: hypothetical protein ALECFALPRED_001362 [Alectoria fallacina]|uniref:Uncharacterized protein n=1 Tax=Alectoria fallacina TaxID=1903189 RepID=A0A8H3IA11_9LECA|nr:MAG: hypothetical protein ALECFALPRED_001362 [Alectoria fallacina]
MLPLAYFPLLLLAEFGSPHALNVTALGPFSNPIPARLNLHPLPNPFPVPNSDITLLYFGMPIPGPPLPQNDVINCFALAIDYLETLIAEQGDRPIAFRYEMTYEAVALKIESENYPLYCITYDEALSVLWGISLKMAREGYQYRRMVVLRTGGLDVLGTAVVRDATW